MFNAIKILMVAFSILFILNNTKADNNVDKDDALNNNSSTTEQYLNIPS